MYSVKILNFSLSFHNEFSVISFHSEFNAVTNVLLLVKPIRQKHWAKFKQSILLFNYKTLGKIYLEWKPVSMGLLVNLI